MPKTRVRDNQKVQGSKEVKQLESKSRTAMPHAFIVEQEGDRIDGVSLDLP